jgi:hypothetical protein
VWLAVIGAVLAVGDGSRKVTDADIDADVSDALPDERSAIGPEAINLSDGSRINRDLSAGISLR